MVPEGKRKGEREGGREEGGRERGRREGCRKGGREGEREGCIRSLTTQAVYSLQCVSNWVCAQSARLPAMSRFCFCTTINYEILQREKQMSITKGEAVGN